MRAVDSVRIFINDVVQQNVVYVSDVERKIRWPDDLPEGACGREIVVGDRGIVVVIARCAEYGEVENASLLRGEGARTKEFFLDKWRSRIPECCLRGSFSDSRSFHAGIRFETGCGPKRAGPGARP